MLCGYYLNIHVGRGARLAFQDSKLAVEIPNCTVMLFIYSSLQMYTNVRLRRYSYSLHMISYIAGAPAHSQAKVGRFFFLGRVNSTYRLSCISLMRELALGLSRMLLARLEKTCPNVEDSDDT